MGWTAFGFGEEDGRSPSEVVVKHHRPTGWTVGGGFSWQCVHEVHAKGHEGTNTSQRNRVRERDMEDGPPWGACHALLIM